MASNKCAVPYCERDYYSAGLCARHYQNLRRFGVPLTPSNQDVVGLLSLLDENLTVLFGIQEVIVSSQGVCPNCGGIWDAHRSNCALRGIEDALEKDMRLLRRIDYHGKRLRPKAGTDEDWTI